MRLKFYSLSTCIWCRKTRTYLDENNISYAEVTVDKLTGGEREEALRELARFNPNKSFPTLVFENGKIVIGYKPDDIRDALKK
ncbi:MAG: glutaredoxin family protein [candidate division FCPU426 bacterium]